MNINEELPQDTTSAPPPSPASNRPLIGRIVFIACFALVALVIVGGIIGFVATRDEAPSETARDTNALAERNGFEHAEGSASPDSIVTANNDSGQGTSVESSAGNIDPSLPQNGGNAQSEVADPGTPSNPAPPLSIPNITVPDNRFPIVNIDLVGPTLVSGISIWCTPNYRWEFQVDDPAGVASVWATYRVNGVFHSINFERGILDNGWWGGTGIANPQGVGYTNFVISARDTLGNISRTNLLGAC